MKTLFPIILVCLMSVPLFAQTDDGMESLKISIDRFIEDEATQDLTDLLEGLTLDEQIKFAEKYILDRAKQFILASDLDYAQALAEIVLLFDIDNNSAQDLYASIEVARREQKELAEKQRLAEEEKKRREEEKARIAREKAEEEKRLAEEKVLEEERIARQQAYDKSVSEIGVQNLSGFASISPAYFLLYDSGFADGLTGETTVNSAYGVEAKGFIRFSHPYIRATLNIEYGYHFLNLTDGDLFSRLNATASVSTPLLNFPLALRLGYAASAYQSTDGSNPSTVLFQECSSFILGLGIDDLHIGSRLSFSAGADFLTAFFTNELLDFAMRFIIAGRIKLFAIGKSLDFALYPNVTGSIFLSDSVLEWAMVPSFAAGVTINEK